MAGVSSPSILTLESLQHNPSQQHVIDRIMLQQMLKQALQVNNPSKEWFADIIKRTLGIVSSIAKKQQEQGIDIPPEVRAILDPKALMKDKSCLKISKQGKVAPKCVREGQWVVEGGEVYVIVKNKKGTKSWQRLGGLSSEIKASFVKSYSGRNDPFTPPVDASEQKEV